MSDREDDLTIGIHSTAIFFGRLDRLMIGLLQTIVTLLWLWVAFINRLSMFFYILFIPATLLFIYQQYLLKDREPSACFKAFLNNHYYGALMWLSISLSFHKAFV